MENLLIGMFDKAKKLNIRVFFFLRWTFAVLCFEMAAGQPPFSGKDHIQLYEYVPIKKKFFFFENKFIIKSNC